MTEALASKRPISSVSAGWPNAMLARRIQPFIGGPCDRTPGTTIVQDDWYIPMLPPELASQARLDGVGLSLDEDSPDCTLAPSPHPLTIGNRRHFANNHPQAQAITPTLMSGAGIREQRENS